MGSHSSNDAFKASLNPDQLILRSFFSDNKQSINIAPSLITRKLRQRWVEGQAKSPSGICCQWNYESNQQATLESLRFWELQTELSKHHHEQRHPSEAPLHLQEHGQGDGPTMCRVSEVLPASGASLLYRNLGSHHCHSFCDVLPKDPACFQQSLFLFLFS